MRSLIVVAEKEALLVGSKIVEAEGGEMRRIASRTRIFCFFVASKKHLTKNMMYVNSLINAALYYECKS